MKEKDFKDICDSYRAKCMEKHKSFGHENVLALGLEGVINLLLHNVLALRVMIRNKQFNNLFEDKLMDAHNYCVILKLLKEGKWIH